jgi:uncharacterized membrane protein
MDKGDSELLSRRVERLEARVKEHDRELQRVLRALDGASAGEVEPPVTDLRSSEPGLAGAFETARPDEGGEGVPGGPGERVRRGFELPFKLGEMENLRSWEWWLNKVGISLLLFGVAFLFSLAADRGWITPEVRIGIGLSIGGVLLVLGLRFYEDRRIFSQALLGGGIGVLYITGYATLQLYALVPYAVAFAFMAAVTLLAFCLSLRQDEVSLSVIASAGGMATPFVLYSGAGSLSGLVLYTCVILAGTSAIYLYKGWRSLLLVSSVGTWSVFLAGVSGALPLERPDRLALQFGALFAWISLWLIPVAREALRTRRPARWPLPQPGRLIRELFAGHEYLLRSSTAVHLLSVATPLVALAFTQVAWDLSEQTLGWVTFGAAASYALAATGLRCRRDVDDLAYTQALVSLMLGTLALVFVLEGDALFFSLAAEAAVLHLAARRLRDRALSLGGHALFSVVGIWLAGRIVFDVAQELLVPGRPLTALFGVRALVELVVIGLVFGTSVVLTPRSVRRAYRIAGHALVLAWISGELLLLPDSGTWVLLCWALYAAGLHLLSRRHPEWGTVVGAHLLSGVVGLWVAARLLGLVPAPDAEIPVFNLAGLVDLAAILLSLISSLCFSGRIALSYRITAHAVFLAWLWRELQWLPGGDALVTAAWSFYAAGLLVAGLRLDRTLLVRGGLVTLFLVVGKLFLVDLVWVEAGWRVVLFLGLGGLFLLLSYYLQALWKPTTDSSRREPGR